MEIIVFILLAGVWAAFLLPSFFDHRRQTPRAATRDYARSKQLLASVSTSSPIGPGYVQRHARARRKRTLLALAGAAAATLVLAVVTGSVIWLGVTIAIDVAVGVYITMLLMIAQRSAAATSVVHLPVVEEPQPEPLEETLTVRVIAG